MTRLFTLTRMPSHKTLHFLRRGQPVSLSNVPPTRTLLEVLREDLGCTGTKEGCGEGDCGACTVVLGEADASGGLSLRAINSCIRLAHSVEGMAVWTSEDIAADPLVRAVARHEGSPPGLHPVQEALVQCHGSQCGFCTPGFVMSLFALYECQTRQGKAVSRELAQRELSGNLCRCTGYRPILDAAQQMHALPAMHVDRQAVLGKLGEMAQARRESAEDSASYLAPGTLAELLVARAAHPQAQLVAGCTDVGLWITKMHMDFERVLDVSRTAELRAVNRQGDTLVIGAAVPLEDAFQALAQTWPQLSTFASRFAGLPVRNSGTLGGNVANGSPIGDSMPLLIALGARIVLASQRGERELPVEDFYTGYRKNVLSPDEVLAFIRIPLPAGKADAQGQPLLRAYKISKRYDDDISAVCLAISLSLDQGRVAHVSIGAGGVAATPVRARLTEELLIGQPWDAATVKRALRTLKDEFQPISDMRASADYRQQVLGNLLQRFWLESQGEQHINLESFGLEAIA
ncbi:MAG: xanthine dehydrogenase small subunit [Pseudomonadota bacterium]